MSISAAFKTMNPNFPIYDKDKKHGDELKRYISGILQNYEGGWLNKILDPNAHSEFIIKFADDTTDRHKYILHKEKFRIGVTQKLLNLFLKYLWVLGYLNQDKQPASCPFDSQILGALGINDRWTEVDDIKKYEQWISAAVNVAEKENKSIAEWELEKFNGLNYG